MKKFFKDIRHNDIDAVRAAIAKNPAVVNEYFDGKAPKKDVGQSPLQVAIKCGQFEIIDLLLENGADADFMEDPTTTPPHSISMPLINDAIIGAMDTILYRDIEGSKKYTPLIEKLLEKGADPNKKTFRNDGISYSVRPVGTLVFHAKENLSRYGKLTYSDYAAYFDFSKKQLFTILDLLKKYGADFDAWLDEQWGDETYRTAFLDEFVPKEDKPYEMKYHGRTIKGVTKGDVDWNKDIRAALREYFGLDKTDGS